MKNVIIPKEFDNRIEGMLKEYSVLYVAADVGMGKTSVILAYLKRQKISYTYVRAQDDYFQEKLMASGTSMIVVDDFQDLFLENEEYLKSHFYDLLREHHFLLLSRALMPAWLKPYQIIGQLGILDDSVLRFGEWEVKAYLEKQQIYLDQSRLLQICEALTGYPLALTFLACMELTDDMKVSSLTEKIEKDVFDYYDEIAFRNWDREVYAFMMQMGGFQSFTVEMASMVSGYPMIQESIDELEKKCMFLTRNDQEYVMSPLVRQYFVYKQERLLSKSAVYSIYHNAALYYELQSDLKHALKYYSRCGDQDKIKDLLIRNSNLHPGIASYLEVEAYYRAFPKEKILETPDLMCGMCMLCSLSFQVEESEYWYEALKQYLHKMKKTDIAYKYVKGRLYWLGISLPHRGSASVEKLMVGAATQLKNKEFSVQDLSITSNLPSVLNGGKDFSCWVPRAEKVYRILKPSASLVLGKGGEGIADICMAEAMLEKADPNTYQIIDYLNRGIYQATAEGKIETQFVGTAVMHRLYLSQGNMESAYQLLMDFRSKAEQNHQMLLNLNAMLIKYDLTVGKMHRAEVWMKEEAPNENERFNIFERYRYTVKARCYIAQQKYTEGILLLNRMIQYSVSYDRTIVRIHAKMLLAIILYRMKDAAWKMLLQEALEEAQQYQYIRMFAEEGAALLPLLQQFDGEVDKDYMKRLLVQVKQAAMMYPSYLKVTHTNLEALTMMERQVLKLLGRGMKNKEIGEFLNISLNTVAYHTKNIYQKLGVNNRTQATNIAKSMDL